MSGTQTAVQNTDLTDVGGIGTQTAENLLDQFDSENIVFDAVQSVPKWVQSNIEGVGSKNLSNLQSYASDRGHRDQTERTLSSLNGTKFQGRYENYYYACGQRIDNVCLFYTGYYQGKEYTTSISGRQNLTKKKAHRPAWTFYSFSEREHIVLEYERRLHSGKYLADIIDSEDWKTITDTGMIYYQRNRNYKPEHYPDTTKGIKTGAQGIGSTSDLLPSLELVGITTDRIALYRKKGTNSIFKFVKSREDGFFRRLHGQTRFKTDRDYDLGEFGTLETFVKTLADNDEWKTYGHDTYVTEKYEDYL